MIIIKKKYLIICKISRKNETNSVFEYSNFEPNLGRLIQKYYDLVQSENKIEYVMTSLIRPGLSSNLLPRKCY